VSPGISRSNWLTWGESIEAGNHVFVEKPHVIDPAGVRQITVDAELAKQKKLSEDSHDG